MKNSLLVHKHLIIRAEASKPPTDEEQLQNWMREFIDEEYESEADGDICKTSSTNL